MAKFISDEDMEKMSPSNSRPQFISDEDMDKHDLNSKIDPTVSAIRKGVQGASAGFLDEASGGVEALGRIAGLKGLGGSFSDVSISDSGPTLSKDELIKSYYEGRDRKRKYLAQDQIDNPEVSTIAELGGAIVSPVNKVLPNASLATQGAAIGAITGLGNSEAEDLSGMALDTVTGAGTGYVLGKGVEKATPYIQKGTQYVGNKLQGTKNKAGELLKPVAEKLAYFSAGPTLRDVRAAGKDGNKVGRYMLDNELVGLGDDVDSIAVKAFAKQKSTGAALDDLYTRAGKAFEESASKPGFDPLRDKERVMQAARRELGDTVDAQSALNKLSEYLDDVAKTHGDDPFQSAMKQYNSEFDEYARKLEQFKNNADDYNFQLGNAGDDINQAALPGFADDFQRTGTRQRSIETFGDEAQAMSPEAFEYGTQMSLTPINKNIDPAFSGVRGNGFGRAQEQMSLDEIANNRFLQHAEQSNINGTGLTPRSFQNVDETVINNGKGQMQFPIAPEMPVAPVKPSDIRNPMSPRRANDIKGAFDEQINYSRNPLTKEPAKEKAFFGARSEINKINQEGIEQLGSDPMVAELRKLNQDYGYSKQVNQLSKDRAMRDDANKWFGLTDQIAAGASTTYGALTGDWETAFAGMAGKKLIEKYGLSTAATMVNKISKQLLRSPQVAKVATENPKAFGAMVYSLVEKMEGPASSLPKAADSQENQTAKIDKDQILNRLNGSKYQQVLMNAAQKGDQSFNAAHYVLHSRDPEYRKQIEGE